MAKEKDAPKFGVPELAKKLGIEPASARVALRKHKVKKNADGVYGWNSAKEMDAVVAKLRSTGAEKPAKDTKKKAA